MWFNWFGVLIRSILLLGTISCSANYSVPEKFPFEFSETAIKYSVLYPTVIKPKCVQCHDENRQDAGMRFDTYARTMASGSIIPGDAVNSSFCDVLIQNALPSDAPALTDDEVAQICSWIQQGALNN